MKKCLLFIPSSALSVYSRSKVRAAIPKLPNMSLAMIAGSLIEEGADVKIVDLALVDVNEYREIVKKEVLQFKPDMVGVTATTTLFYEADQISGITKSVSTDILTVLGGPHASSLPIESLGESSFDLVVVGEGEKAVKDIARNNDFKEIKGVYGKEYIDNKNLSLEIKSTDVIPIDDLPFPALSLYDSKHYVCPRVISRNNPVGPIEMSRGCVSNCSFCNKKVHGRIFRIKSSKRVIEELIILKKLGYREFHVLDDQFTTNIDKAKEICQEIIRNDIGMSWNLRTGIRVDRVDKEFLDLAKRAGCYQVGIGFESGSQACLDKVGKGIKLEQAIRAAEMIRSAGIEFVGFFMLGLPGETEETMKETINFAIKLNPDYAKATILVPFPGTAIYDEFEKKGLIRTKDWSKYNFHNADEIYQHSSLSWNCLNYYYNLFHRRFYLRPGFLIRELGRSIIQGRLFDDLCVGYQTFLGHKNAEKK